ncbi:MAG: hypothetical protein BRD50_07990 [Bacteroidetes bacterium SW_11_45_7]|nr:MAG: hypothetical protein BRD50_07990 [Bacteroidetes bacterium SW_11_45_7]
MIGGFLTVVCWGCQGQSNNTGHVKTSDRSSQEPIQGNQSFLLHQLNDALSIAVIQDGHKPPVASRIYAYANIAAYEAMVEGHPHFKSLESQLNALSGLPDPQSKKQFDYRVSMIQTFTDVGRELIYRKYILDSTKAHLLDTLRPHISDAVYERSIDYGKKLASSIKRWAATDGYENIQKMPNYTVADSASAWQPTPPTYGEACEPHWYKIRLFAMDSIQQFNPPPPTPFSKEKGSAFYQQAMEVYNFSKDVSKGQEEIAWFWNDRPSNNQVQGHMMSTKRQISPPGHWVNITHIACKKKDLSLIRSAEAYAMVGVAFADAIKANWYTKYHYNLIRPVTYINRYIDSSWTPLLETPMFPEYTSAHSTMSGASAVMLSTLIDRFLLRCSVGGNDEPGLWRYSLQESMRDRYENRFENWQAYHV